MGELGAVKTLSAQQLEQLWAEHLKGEFETKNVEATLATMVEDAYVNHSLQIPEPVAKRRCESFIGMISFLRGSTTST